jgi:hypothetical protein
MDELRVDPSGECLKNSGYWVATWYFRVDPSGEIVELDSPGGCPVQERPNATRPAFPLHVYAEEFVEISEFSESTA